MTNVFVFGNPDLPMDSLPLRILPQLRVRFPDIKFEFKDPNEEWDIPDEFIIIDTVVGVKDVMVFDDIDKFIGAPCVSMHDFDALANLRLLKKLGKIKKLKIIGVPPDIDEKDALKKISDLFGEKNSRDTFK